MSVSYKLRERANAALAKADEQRLHSGKCKYQQTFHVSSPKHTGGFGDAEKIMSSADEVFEKRFEREMKAQSRPSPWNIPSHIEERQQRLLKQSEERKEGATIYYTQP